MEKFGRVYTIDFYIGSIVDGAYKRQIVYNDFVSVTYPLTAEFAIGRSISSYQNTAIVNVYGLDETKRTQLAKDINDTKKYIKMVISAGYEEASSVIFVGAINECYSVRNGGDTEYKTVIDSSDSTIDLFMGETSITLDAGTDTKTTIQQIAKDFIELEIDTVSPNISAEIAPSERKATYDGKTFDILNNLKQSGMSIDNQRVFFLDQEKDVVKSLGTLYVNCDYGLLGTPRRRNAYYGVDLIFEPQAALNQLCRLQSTTAPELNQDYKIMSVAHNGIISGSKGGAMTTSLQLFAGNGAFHYI